MKLLLSIISLDEAKQVIKYQPDLLDIKNPNEGSLGAQFPWVIRNIVDELKDTSILCSATLGDLPFKPGTASLAALGAVTCGANYIKAGLYGISSYNEAFQMMKNIEQTVRITDSSALVVASGYADYKRFGGISYMELIKAARDSNCDVVMVDTAIKDGNNLFDSMNYQELKTFIDAAHDSELVVALAGSIGKQHLESLLELKPDIIGVRGAVCNAGNRNSGINPEKVKAFLSHMNHMQKSVTI